MGFQSKSSLQAENTVDDDDVMEEFNGEDSESGASFKHRRVRSKRPKRGKNKEAKRIAKEVQAEKLKERAKQKKQEIEAVKKWRKLRQQNGFRDGKKGFLDLGFEDSKSFERSSNKRPGMSPGD
ncbi:hypothetical protein Goshw_005366 [Gossypium schwendimanii]|uniref:Uncharacterized protein n=1 Tax=Gossypium schwendimanii TaxID=34291 RepID=A0A7J9LTV0_GOSSC|nr:hypothetical protein [Gossypium schwendimanii]